MSPTWRVPGGPFTLSPTQVVPGGPSALSPPRRVPGVPLTFPLLGLGLAQGRRRRLGGDGGDGGRHLLGHGGSSGGGGGGHGGGGALEGVVGAELPPLGPQDGHHLGHGDFGVLLGDQGPASERQRGWEPHRGLPVETPPRKELPRGAPKGPWWHTKHPKVPQNALRGPQEVPQHPEGPQSTPRGHREVP